MSDTDIAYLRNRLNGVAGTALTDDEMLELVKHVVQKGGGVRFEVDEVSYQLIRRDGRFIVRREGASSRPSTTPPPRRR